MKLELVFVGKTSEKYLEQGVQVYLKRLTHYLPVAISIVPVATKSGTMSQTLKKEADSILKKISDRDFVILLDERGIEYTSVELAGLVNKSLINSVPKLVFIVGGPFGASEIISGRANLILSFSKFTLTHQMIRMFLLEQVYRAMTILNNEPYHHS